ncbi:MAG TPA: hypothetical protein VH331_05895 [Allosphingosinicella sp.]|jgi:hypothetical protein|nr:hypothetical protein [Allosphingosinicella sp.]
MTYLGTIAPAAELAPRQSRALAFLLSGAPSAPGEALALTAEPEVVLGREERAAVLTSLRDGRPSAAGSRWRTRVARIFFGLRPPVSLGNRRLEALRRYAVLYRLESSAMSVEEDERLLDSGLSVRHATAIRALVDAYYVPERSLPRVPWTMAAMVALVLVAAASLYRWLAAQFDDSAGALIVTILLATWVVSISAITAHPHGRHA